MALAGLKPTESLQVTEAPGVSAPAVEADRKPPVLGGYQKMQLGAASEALNFLNKQVNDSKNLKLIGYEKQVVNGWNHRLIFEDKNGKSRIITIYQSPDDAFSISSEVSQEKE